MKIIPYVDKNKKVSQKIVVGDQKGTLQCFGIKKNEVNVSTKFIFLNIHLHSKNFILNRFILIRFICLCKVCINYKR